MIMAIISWILVFVGGLTLGITITAFAKVKGVRNRISESVQNQKTGVAEDYQKAIDGILDEKKKEYLKENKYAVIKTVLGMPTKKDGDKSYFKMYADVVSAVAKTVNPQSPKPLLEFSIKHTFEFIDDVTKKLEEILDYIDLPLLKNSDVGEVYNFVQIGLGIAQNPVVQSGVEVVKKVNPILKVLNFFNPAKWISGLLSAIFTASITRDVIFAVADVVAWQSLKLYLNA